MKGTGIELTGLDVDMREKGATPSLGASLLTPQLLELEGKKF